MKILITGCCGFIGGHLCEQLLQTQNDIMIMGIDNMNDYYNNQIKYKTLEILLKFKNFEFEKNDILNSKLIYNWKPDKVIHLAAMAGVRYSLQNPQLYIDTNIKGFVNILEQIKQLNYNCRLIYASSSSVYGLNSKIPFSESDDIDKTNSIYATTKKCKENFAQLYSQIYNLETIGLRFFTVYGPRGRPDMAPYKFLYNILNNIPIEKYGDGSSSRDYTYIDDIVQGIIATINVNLPKNYEIFNLGNSYPISLNKFIKTCENVSNKKAIIIQKNQQLGDVPDTFADISKAKNLLKYSPKTSIEVGLKNTYEYLLTISTSDMNLPVR